MRTVFLTSRLDICDRDEAGCRIPKSFGNANAILTNLQQYVQQRIHFLFVAADEYNTAENDRYADATFASFQKTLPFHYSL
jgi:hypothetical protein